VVAISLARGQPTEAMIASKGKRVKKTVDFLSYDFGNGVQRKSRKFDGEQTGFVE
jgi:hypothetical protein